MIITAFSFDTPLYQYLFRCNSRNLIIFVWIKVVGFATFVISSPGGINFNSKLSKLRQTTKISHKAELLLNFFDEYWGNLFERTGSISATDTQWTFYKSSKSHILTENSWDSQKWWVKFCNCDLTLIKNNLKENVITEHLGYIYPCYSHGHFCFVKAHFMY